MIQGGRLAARIHSGRLLLQISSPVARHAFTTDWRGCGRRRVAGSRGAHHPLCNPVCFMLQRIVHAANLQLRLHHQSRNVNRRCIVKLCKPTKEALAKASWAWFPWAWRCSWPSRSRPPVKFRDMSANRARISGGVDVPAFD